MKFLSGFIFLLFIIHSIDPVICQLENDNFLFPKFFASSPPHLQLLANKEVEIFNLITKFKSHLVQSNSTQTQLASGTLGRINDYLKDYQETDLKKETSNSRAQLISWNPLASFQLLQRFAVNLKAILINLDNQCQHSSNLKTEIFNLMRDLGWPKDDDVISAMDSIIRIQLVYNLNTTELANGNLKGHQTKIALTSRDSHKIGKYLLDLHYCPSLALDWLQVASAKLNLNCSLNSEELAKDLTHAKNNLLTDDPFEQLRGKNRFWNLCAGENHKSAEETRNLFCWYETKQSPGIWTIGPIKAELLSLAPIIVQYYEVVGEGLMTKLRAHATPKLDRSRVFDEVGIEENRDGEIANFRTSHTAFLNEGDFEGLSKIPRVIEHLTGLTVTKAGAAEKLQVATYASGGHYKVHVDEIPQPIAGGRVATFMIYLTQVEDSGFTAFPVAGVAAKPFKGSAVLWFNLLSSGELDERTEHGACPVILGEKWVANKWILFEEQFSTHKCGLKPGLPIEFKVNGKSVKLY